MTSGRSKFYGKLGTTDSRSGEVSLQLTVYSLLEEHTSIDPDRLVRPIRERRNGGHVRGIECTRRPTKV